MRGDEADNLKSPLCDESVRAAARRAVHTCRLLLRHALTTMEKHPLNLKAPLKLI